MQMMKTVLAISFLSVTQCKQNSSTQGFEKIIFHTSQCFGACPVYHLEIDSNKSIRLFAEWVFKGDIYYPVIDSSKIGFFSGLLKDTLYDKLIVELQTIGLDSLNFDQPNCCDASIITIIVYYYGKRKYLSSMWPPQKAQKLISILYQVCRTNGLKRSNKAFEIED